MVQVPILYPYKLKRSLYWYRTSLLLLPHTITLLWDRPCRRWGGKLMLDWIFRVSQLQALLRRNVLGICYEEQRPIRPIRLTKKGSSNTNEKCHLLFKLHYEKSTKSMKFTKNKRKMMDTFFIYLFRSKLDQFFVHTLPYPRYTRHLSLLGVELPFFSACMHSPQWLLSNGISNLDVVGL